jgi:hypothetical protein
LCECVLPDNDEIAESIDDVRGGARAISTLCAGATAAIGGRVPSGEPPDGFDVRTGSETLREAAFDSWGGRVYLDTLDISISRENGFTAVVTSNFSPR